MNKSKLLREYDLTEDELRQQLQLIFGEDGRDWLPPEGQRFGDNRLVTGRVRRLSGDAVWVDVGYKSEGAIGLCEWYEEEVGRVLAPRPGDEVEVVLDRLEDDSGTVALSFRKAKRRRAWDEFFSRHGEGDVVEGKVTRQTRGGLLVDIGVSAFMPASQVDVRPPGDLGRHVGTAVECKIIRIDRERQSVVVSRRKLLEERRDQMRANLLGEIAVGQVRPGLVKNVVPYGAFVDLGGIDGLLHVIDMSWGRVSDPHLLVRVGQPVEVYVLRVDRAQERIAVSLKHKTPSPWQDVETRYPAGTRHAGEVVRLAEFGAFVELEPGVTGLLHVSEWLARDFAPHSEAINVGDRVEVAVLRVDPANQKMWLSRKRLDRPPG
jgi:small subunit ribosomal protein S1